MNSSDRPADLDRRVLIVEDEARLRQMLIRAIHDMDFDPTEAADAETGLRTLAEKPHGIVLSDLNLPGLHGLEFCQQVRERWPETQILILTGYGDLEAAKTAIRLDIVDFLTKPCSLGELEVALDRALRRRRHHVIAHPPEDQAWTDDPDDPASAREEHRRLEDVERKHILDTLARLDGNRDATAAELGISVRTLYYRLKLYAQQDFYSLQ